MAACFRFVRMTNAGFTNVLCRGMKQLGKDLQQLGTSFIVQASFVSALLMNIEAIESSEASGE